MNLPLDEIQLGSFYEINLNKFSPKHPNQLKRVRILMVSDKTENCVAVRYPSAFSLRTYFNGGLYTRRDTKRMPALDEKYVMDLRNAREVFVRRILSKELEEMKGVPSFWSSSSTSGVDGGVSKKGLCWSELKCSNMVHWGNRRRVRFLSRHEENATTTSNVNNNYNLQLLSSSAQDEDDEAEKDLKEERGGGGGEGDEESEETGLLSKKSRKRNGNDMKTTANTQKNTRARSDPRRNQTAITGKRKIAKHSISRWSADRYKLAEQNMLKIMKEKAAVFGNPILRHELRIEARKLIGDTGLLDHLLKHMAGKLAPGGEERFRRRHNADGAMEYWLESAHLMNIRIEAGVQDPYWIPPPGWQPGDNPSQDPVCAREIKELKEQIDKLRRKLEEFESEKQEGHRELVLVTSPTSTDMQSDASLVQRLKEKHSELMQKKAAIEEQLMEISQSLDGIEEETLVLSTTVEGSKKSHMKTSSQGTNIVPRKKEQGQDEQLRNDDKLMKYTENTDSTNKGAISLEDKAAKIQRLKIGFRICRPQGTFLWPNMAPSPGAGSATATTAVHHVEDFLVPTPPSVSSSTNPPLLPNQPTSPVKPLAKKFPVSIATTAAISSVMKPITTLEESHDLINLNDVPISYSHHIDNHRHQGLVLGAPHTPFSSALPLTYKRRHNSCPIASAATCLLSKQEVGELNQWESQIKQGHGHENEQRISRVLSNPSLSASSSMPQSTGLGGSSWLALATPNPTLPKPTRGYSSPC